MSNGDLLRTIEYIAEGGAFFDKLRGAPPQIIDQAIRILSDSRTASSLARLLRTVRQLQGSSLRSNGSGQAPARHSPNGLEGILRGLFADKRRFPSVASIADFAATVFQVRVARKDKEGRERYIKHLVTDIKDHPEAMANARNALVHSGADQKDQAYATLYNFIRGRLTE